MLIALKLTGCSALVAHTELTDDKAAFSRLKKAVAEGDSSALPVAIGVLQDVLERKYTYKSDTFELAFDLIGQLRPVEVSPLLREIAVMRYRDEPGPLQTRELIAIQRALGVLADMRDTETANISLRLLNADSWLQRVALESLAKTEAWEATPNVISMLESTALDKDHLFAIVKAMQFLNKSTETKSETCRVIDLVIKGYPDCMQPGSRPYCGDFPETVAQLKRRLQC